MLKHRTLGRHDLGRPASDLDDYLDWQERLETDFPNSSFFLLDSTTRNINTVTLIESQRDYAWSLAQESYKDAYDEFNRLYIEEQDTLSAYIIGFISDTYLNDIERSLAMRSMAVAIKGAAEIILTLGKF